MRFAILTTLVTAAGIFGGSTTVAQLDRNDFVSDASHIVGTYQPADSDHSPQAMVTAVNEFLDSLDDQQRQVVKHSIDSRERREWTNLPARPDAGGITLGALNETQLKKACDMMAAMFSKQGYQKLVNIMLADDTLLRGGRPRPGFGTETFALVIFGDPSTTEPWAFQLDGHHVGVNVSVVGDNLTMSPSFIGTQPESFRLDGNQVRPLSDSVDMAYKLATSLDDDQRDAAVIRPKRGRILTGPGNDGVVPEMQGLSASRLNDQQKEMLLVLIGSWVRDMPSRYAEPRMEAIKDGIDDLQLAWNGETTAGSDISWRIQGPTLIIEFACQDLGGNPLNHLHTMYRDPTNDYAGQIPPPR